MAWLQLAVIREFDLYTRWMPLCSESRVIFRRGCEQTFYLRFSAGLLGWYVDTPQPVSLSLSSIRAAAGSIAPLGVRRLEQSDGAIQHT